MSFQIRVGMGQGRRLPPRLRRPRHPTRPMMMEDDTITLTALWNAPANAYESYPVAAYAYNNIDRYYPFMMTSHQSPFNFYAIYYDNNITTHRGWTSNVYLLDEHYIINNNQDDNILGPQNLETDQRSFENLERFKIGEKEACESNDESMMCSICLEELSIGSEAIRLPNPCFHVYHQHCIIEWLNKSNTCPLCRRPVS